MKKQELSKDITHYMFDPRPGQVWGTNATVILNGDKAILIDTGYETQTPVLLEELASSNITVETVIITHFHDDHMEGLKTFPGIPVYGSARFREALEKYTPKGDHKYFTPTIPVSKPKTIVFGEHTITMIPFPGHSECTMLVKINDEFVHVADEVFFSDDGKLLLPCLDGKSEIPRQLKSLNKLKDYSGFTIIPGHGMAFGGDGLIGAIENLCTYLKAVSESSDAISFEDATRDCNDTFVYGIFHEGNCK